MAEGDGETTLSKCNKRPLSSRAPSQKVDSGSSFERFENDTLLLHTNLQLQSVHTLRFATEIKH